MFGMGVGDRYCNRFVFPHELNEDGIRTVFFQVDETIGSHTEHGIGGSKLGYAHIGHISKAYNDGFAHFDLSFEEKEKRSPHEEKLYTAVNFAADTLYDQRRKLTED
jgi:hypothetical protein